MAQIAIPLVIAGVLYLISNDKKETFIDNPNEGEDDIIKNSIENTSLSTNNEGIYSQYQDKYASPSLTKKQIQSFTSLTGENVTDLKHNNMKMFYNNKSNGAYSQQAFTKNDNTLDNYTGAGSMNIEKSEVSCFFKPHENMQNVYGNQNQSDFMQSRVVESKKFANTKPWEEIKVAPGTSGFNSGMENREKWIDKTVDELRIETNPKSNYLQNYVPPAYKAADRGILGKVIKKSPDSFHINNGVQDAGGLKGIDKPTQMSEQMLTDENREHTSVSYYGTRVADNAGYVTGKYDDPHKPELPTNPYINLAANNVFPESDHGKASFKSYNNNRNNEGEYMGAVKGLFMANVVNPIVNGLKHTKKTNFVENNNPTGFINGMKQQMVYGENKLPATNRQIQGDRIGLNYLQVNKQSSDGYITANPYLIGQQRESTNSQTMGAARGLSGATSYNAEYNQRGFQKPIDNREPMGNKKEFNNVMHVNITGTEQCNMVQPAFHNPYAVANRIISKNTTQPQQYKNINDEYNNADMLKAFKQNPYTKSLSSVA